ncbi:MAG: hypothetical protein ABR910_08760 [Acidobacteriaceae bacterium]|jgi:hypothetical protein
MSNRSPAAVLRPWNCNPYQEARPTWSQRLTLKAVFGFGFVPAFASGAAGAVELTPDGNPSLAETSGATVIIIKADASTKTGIITLVRAAPKEVLLIRTLHLLLSCFDPLKSNIRKRLIVSPSLPKMGQV